MPESERRRFGTRDLAERQKQVLPQVQDLRKIHEEALKQDQHVAAQQYEYAILLSLP